MASRDLFWLLVRDYSESTGYKILDFGYVELEVRRTRHDYIRFGMFTDDRLIVVKAGCSNEAMQKAQRELVMVTRFH
ncbi:hypothetical protein GTO91_03470 [Heliobacterium undosum]|uniref:Uncharacterized protein n=1 Tax=Heliomicrobium undosum TaxID=121734 RepID=A0A845KY84_9FIRM|nr:hypothetical protein [Heliomicrobium undosum]MZP28767.1 hypothetical protein [Heliomicrobium undosum]